MSAAFASAAVRAAFLVGGIAYARERAAVLGHAGQQALRGLLVLTGGRL